MNLENNETQNTTLKKAQKCSQNQNNFLEYSNNSAKTQLLNISSNQKSNVSDYMELNFSNTIAPETTDLLCQENLQLEIEEDLSLFNKESNLNDPIQEENIASFADFKHETGFEYTYETLQYLIKKENEYSPACNYFKAFQKNITPYMRAILLDWMMEVCNEFTLKRETFHLAVNYVDRVLSLSQNVAKSELQLIGVVCMFIAAKVEVLFEINFFLKNFKGSLSTKTLRLRIISRQCLFS